MIRTLLRLVIGVFGLLALLLALRLWTDPAMAAAQLGVESLAPLGVATLRADFAGFFAAAGAFALAAAIRDDRRLLTADHPVEGGNVDETPTRRLEAHEGAPAQRAKGLSRAGTERGLRMGAATPAEAPAEPCVRSGHDRRATHGLRQIQRAPPAEQPPCASLARR